MASVRRGASVTTELSDQCLRWWALEDLNLWPLRVKDARGPGRPTKVRFKASIATVRFGPNVYARYSFRNSILEQDEERHRPDPEREPWPPGPSQGEHHRDVLPRERRRVRGVAIGSWSWCLTCQARNGAQPVRTDCRYWFREVRRRRRRIRGRMLRGDSREPRALRSCRLRLQPIPDARRRRA